MKRVEIGLELGLGRLVAACALPLMAADKGAIVHLRLRMGGES